MWSEFRMIILFDVDARTHFCVIGEKIHVKILWSTDVQGDLRRSSDQTRDSTNPKFRVFFRLTLLATPSNQCPSSWRWSKRVRQSACEHQRWQPPQQTLATNPVLAHAARWWQKESSWRLHWQTRTEWGSGKRRRCRSTTSNKISAILVTMSDGTAVNTEHGFLAIGRY